MPSSVSPTNNLSYSLDLIEVLDILISDLFLNFSESSAALPSNTCSSFLKNSLFYRTKSKPSLTLKDYLKRFQNLTKCSNEVFVLGFIYFDKIVQKNKLALEKINIHK